MATSGSLRSKSGISWARQGVALFVEGEKVVGDESPAAIDQPEGGRRFAGPRVSKNGERFPLTLDGTTMKAFPALGGQDDRPGGGNEELGGDREILSVDHHSVRLDAEAHGWPIQEDGRAVTEA